MANLTNSAKLISEMEKKANTTDLGAAALSNQYSDLDGKPTIPTVNNSTITIQKNSSNVDSFTTNASSNKTINIELTKADVGLGNVDNTSDANKPVSNATQTALNAKANASDVYTKAEVDAKVSSVYKYKGSKTDYDSLPSSGNVAGDVWNVETAHTTAPIFPAGSNLAWDGSAWDVLGGTVDLSGYVTLSTAQTISGTKTFSAEPVLPSKTSAATNDGTKPATEAQVYSKADASDLNTKTFYLSSTSDLTNAQAALDWYLAGKNPIISFKSSDDSYTSIYILHYCNSTTMQFMKDLNTKKVYDSYTSLGTWILKFSISSGTVTSIQYSGQTSLLGYVLNTNTDYSTPYTPQYNGSPATKKYVDDSVAGISGGHDYSWETATISSGAVTLGLRTIVEPTSNFTLNAPSDLQDGMEYVLRCVNGSTAYTLTLGTGFVNDFGVDLTLHANHSDQFTFVAYDGTLELQPEYQLAGEDNNTTKIFRLSGTTGATAINEMQAAYDWVAAGKDALLYYDRDLYVWRDLGSTELWWYDTKLKKDGTALYQQLIQVSVSSGTVTTITLRTTQESKVANVLALDNTSSFTPTADYQPATKKYVDDNAGITNDTTGTTTTVQKIWAGTEAQFNALTTKSESTIYHVY